MAKDKQQIKFEADIKGFKSAIKEANSSITSLNKELKLNQEQLKGNSNNINSLQEKLKILKEEYKKQTEVIKNSESAYKHAVELFGENSEEAKKWSDRIVEAKTKQEKIKNAINETNEQIKKQTEQIKKQTNSWLNNGESLQKVGEKYDKLGNKIDKIGNKLSIVSAGVGAGLVGILKSSIDYESAFAGVTKTVDATAEQLNELRTGILNMSTRMPAAATEIAGVAEMAGQLGIQTDNILSFSEAMIGLGQATNLTADEAATQLAQFANIMQMSQQDFDKLGSAIVDLGNNFATTEADIVSMAMRLAGAGKQVGLSEGEVLGLATALSSVGIEAEMGGSAISKAMVKMENAVANSGEKLSKVLKKSGMSLRQLELTASNDSLGFKSLCDSLGMTTSEVKNLITAGTNLEDFSKVAGMTAEQFKKAWKDDAAGALGAFIQGLGHAEDKGESAITMLTEMGLTEVRLRDSLLRAANAGDLFNNAISTGTKAWKENTALTKEVEKRYETTESQMKMLKNEAIKLAIEFGDELAPSLRDLLKDVKPLLNEISNAIKWFSKLDDKTKQTTIKVLALTVAAGPLVKTIGNLTSVAGKGLSAIGKLSTKIGEAQTTSIKANTSFTKMAGGMSIAVTGALLLADALHKWAIKTTTEAKTTAENFSNQINNMRDSMNEYRDSIDNNTRVELTHIDNVKKLKEELITLTDENGRVRDGYKARAEYILGELNNALGTEYKLNGNMINSYKEMSENIDKLIEKRKAEIILSSSEEKYKKALEEQQKLNTALIDSRKAIEDYAAQYDLSVDELDKKVNELRYMYEDIPMNELLKKCGNEFVTNLRNFIDGYDTLVDAHDTAADNIRKNDEDIKKYEENHAKFLEGKYDEIGKEKLYTTKDYNDKSLYELRRAISKEQSALKENLQNFKETRDNYSKEQADKAEANLKTLAETLKARTKTVGELGEEEIIAWRLLGTRSYDIYKEQLDQMDPALKRTIENATGIVATDVSLATAFGNLGKHSITKFKSNDFNGAGADAAKQLAEGARQNTGLFTQVGNSFASKLSTALVANSSTFNTKGSHADGLAYVPYNGYTARLHEGERILSKSENADYIRNNISNKTNNNVNFNIYTQQLSDSDLIRISNFVDRKWGKRN